MRRWTTAGVPVACVVVAVGTVQCGGDDSTIGGQSDSGVDAPITDATRTDTGGSDGGVDAGGDATIDAPSPSDASDASDTGLTDAAGDVVDGGEDAADADAGAPDATPPLLGCSAWTFSDPIVLE